MDPDLHPDLDGLAAQARALAAALTDAANACSRGQKGSLPSIQIRVEEDKDDEDVRLAATARDYLRARRLREELFAPGLFCDPAWDLLLDLFASEIEEKRVCVSDASIAANVPQTTGLRWLDMLGRHELVVRRPDPGDGRRCFIELTPNARVAIAAWLRAAFPATLPPLPTTTVKKVRHGHDGLVTALGAASQV
jgi:hypothetical protein